MATKIFINLPVSNLARSREFFSALGYHFNPQFSDATGACMIISEDIYAMLLTHEKISMFTTKSIADARTSTEVLIALSCESKDAVNSLMEKALAAGATETRPPQDYGFMFGRSFDDPDGHIWELFWMDPSHIQDASNA